MKTLSSAIVLGIGFWMLSGSPARAQVGGMGEGLKKGAGDAVKQEIMKGVAEKAGLPAPGAPGAAGAAATAPAGEPPVVAPAAADAPAAAPGSETGAANAPAGEPKVAPGVADAPTPAPGAGGTTQDAAGVGKMMPKLP